MHSYRQTECEQARTLDMRCFAPAYPGDQSQVELPQQFAILQESLSETRERAVLRDGEAYDSGLLCHAEARIWIGGHVMDGGWIECAMHVLFIATSVSHIVRLDIANGSHC